ncbi:MAG: hypothetical protein WCZ66_09280 [Sphingomonadaceae bacterium]
MMQDSTKTGLDVAAAGITVATVLQWLPAWRCDHPKARGRA